MISNVVNYTNSRRVTRSIVRRTPTTLHYSCSQILRPTTQPVAKPGHNKLLLDPGLWLSCLGTAIFLIWFAFCFVPAIGEFSRHVSAFAGG